MRLKTWVDSTVVHPVKAAAQRVITAAKNNFFIDNSFHKF
jgi:hypothetical protein